MRPLSAIAFGCRLALLLVPAPSCFLAGQSNHASCVAEHSVAGHYVGEHYKAIALPLKPARIDESGQVVGTTAGHRAALWSEKTGLRELPLPAGFYNSEGVAVNNSGQATGVVFDRNFSKHQAFIFANNILTLLAGEQSRSYDINDSGEVAGESLLPGSKATAPVSWNKNAIRALGGCCGGSAKGVDRNADIIGDVYDETGRYQAFLWNAKQGIQLIGPADRYSSAIALNDHGHVVIQAFSDVFLYAGTSLTRLELSRNDPSQPRAINNCDVVVGSSGPFADAERAFVWDRSHGFLDLNTLIASDSGWTLEAATSINDHGEIVGWGDYKDEEDTGFLLIPED